MELLSALEGGVATDVRAWIADQIPFARIDVAPSGLSKDKTKSVRGFTPPAT
jgi:hypothetical protein